MRWEPQRLAEVENYRDNSSDRVGNDRADLLTSCGNPPPPEALAIIPIPSAGTLTTCIADANRVLQCWGANTGAGAEATAFVPMTPIGVGPIKEVAQSASTSTACAIVDNDSPGSVWCWFGTGTPAPIKNSDGTSLSGMRGISVGGVGACAIRSSDAAALCWRYPQVPGTSALWQATPSSVATLPTGIIQVSVGSEFACALQGSPVTQVFCWGENARGQLGRGVASAGELRPAAITNLQATQISWVFLTRARCLPAEPSSAGEPMARGSSGMALPRQPLCQVRKRF